VIRFCCLALVLLLLGGCAERRVLAERVLHEVGPDVLREDAARLYKEWFGGSRADFSVVSKSAWPASFQRFAPKRIGAYPDGFGLALETDADTERGVFVIPLHFEGGIPRRAADVRFEPMAEGIYWYEFARQAPGG
jgi:hypothetical protein